MISSKPHTIIFETYLIDPKPGEVNIIQSLQPPPDTDIQYPGEGLNVLYGVRFASEALTSISREVQASGKKMVPVKIRMTATRPKNASHWFDTYVGKSVFDMRRLNESVKEQLREIWKKYLSNDLKEKGWEEDILESRLQDMVGGYILKSMNFIELRPYYVDRLRKEPGFENIDAFIWPTVVDGKKTVRATIYNAKNISMVSAMRTGLRVALPEWLPK